MKKREEIRQLRQAYLVQSVRLTRLEERAARLEAKTAHLDETGFRLVDQPYEAPRYDPSWSGAVEVKATNGWPWEAHPYAHGSLPNPHPGQYCDSTCLEASTPAS